MSFEPIGKFIFPAAEHKHLGTQAKASLICEKAKQFFRDEYKKDSEDWLVLKFVDHKLFIKPFDSGQASDLFLNKYKILESFKSQEFLNEIQDIKFQK